MALGLLITLPKSCKASLYLNAEGVTRSEGCAFNGKVRDGSTTSTPREEMERLMMMKRVLAAFTSVAVFAALAPVAGAQSQQCPAEVGQAQAMLAKAPKAQAARGQDVQAPRSLAGARTQDQQAPRSSTQDVQAPRSSTQDVQAPRSVAGAKTSGGDPAKLVSEAEAACKAGKMDVAKSKAIEAIGLMK